ncbi:MAG: TlpA family protein disulfide reductase [Bdellovibrionales bacterium]
MALAMAALITLAIYSLSQLSTLPWTSSLSTPTLSLSLRKDLPRFEASGAGEVITPQNFQGKWTLLTFWSTTCPPCHAEMPSLNQLALNWQGPEFQILTVNVDKEGSPEGIAAKSMLREQELILPTFFDNKKELMKAFQVEAFPTHFLVNPDLKIVWEAVGAYDWDSDETREQLSALMESQAPEWPQSPVE